MQSWKIKAILSNIEAKLKKLKRNYQILRQSWRKSKSEMIKYWAKVEKNESEMIEYWIEKSESEMLK